MSHGTEVLRNRRHRVVNPILGIACLTIAATIAATVHGAVASRHYDFEEGAAGATSLGADDIVTEFLFPGPAGVFPEGHFWIEVAGGESRPLPAGNLVESVTNAALAATALEPRQGVATYADVSNGSVMDSPAVGSQLALSFDGNAFLDDGDTGPGSRGVYVSITGFENNEPVAGGTNTSESFNLITQAWVRPSSEGIEIPQTVWVAGTEQGSVNITEDGFWEFRDLGSVGVLNPNILVDFDAWTHIGVRRGGNGAEVFINGEIVAGNIDPAPPNFFNTFASLITLGGDASNSNGFIGLVDDFKVMGTADLSWDPMVDLDYWATEEETARCDFDGNGACDIADLDALLYDGQSQQILDPYDLNSDGVVDLADRDAWYASASTENGVELVPGDTNLDGLVVASDLNDLGTNWQRTDATSVAQGDFNGDGLVAASDLNDIGINWQRGVAAAANASAVPEPSGCLALLTAMTLWFVAGRRR